MRIANIYAALWNMVSNNGEMAVFIGFLFGVKCLKPISMMV